jgi:predicted dehydrogenase
MNTALRVGLIGAGYMGRAHAIALHSVGATFGPRYAVECAALADHSAQSAASAADLLGFRRPAADWRELVEDPAIDLIDICAPNYLHCEMALAALRAGKHVYCEKPLANDVRGALEVARAAETSGRCCAIGFNYICNPLLQLARELIASGELGAVVSFNGRYLEDYMSDPHAPHTWRCERRLAGAGALADLGSHLINLAHLLIGPIARVAGALETVHRERARVGEGRARAVENEDSAHVLVEFASGVRGVMQISRIATGRKCGLAFEVQGTRGSIAFDQERMNELRLYSANDAQGRRGFRTVLAGPEHPDYAAFCPAPGHGLGVNDLKVIEVRNVVRAVRGEQPMWPDFAEGLRVQQVMAAIEASHAGGGWARPAQEG